MLFNRQRFLGIRTAVFLAVAIGLISVDHHYQSASSIRSLLTVIVTPIQYLVTGPIEVVRWADNAITTRRMMNTENIKLNSEKLLLQAQLQQMNALAQENNQLRSLLNASEHLKASKFLAAELVSVDLAPFTHQVIIDKGSEQGIYEGQPVVDSNGVMGQIVYVFKKTARLALITDASTAVPVENMRNGARAIASGLGDSPNLQLLYVPDTADFKEGDILVTSGLGQHYLEGYPVGEIVSIKHEAGTRFAKIVVKPRAKLNRSRHVLLVWPSSKTKKG